MDRLNDRQTHTTENITFATSLAGGKNGPVECYFGDCALARRLNICQVGGTFPLCTLTAANNGLATFVKLSLL